MGTVLCDSSFLRGPLHAKPVLELSDHFSDIYIDSGEGPPVFKSFIGGEWVTSSTGKVFPLKSPIDGEVIAYVQSCSEDDMQRAIKAAKSGQRGIRDIAAIERIEIFRQAAQMMKARMDDFVRTLIVEAGKTREDATGEVRATIDRMLLTMEETRKIFGEYIPGDWSDDTRGKVALVIHEPVGVVGAIGSFNYPLYIPAAKLIPALLAGNSVVVKPSSADPISQLLLAKILEECRIPPPV